MQTVEISTLSQEYIVDQDKCTGCNRHHIRFFVDINNRQTKYPDRYITVFHFSAGCPVRASCATVEQRIQQVINLIPNDDDHWMTLEFVNDCISHPPENSRKWSRFDFGTQMFEVRSPRKNLMENFRRMRFIVIMQAIINADVNVASVNLTKNILSGREWRRGFSFHSNGVIVSKKTDSRSYFSESKAALLDSFHPDTIVFYEVDLDHISKTTCVWELCTADFKLKWQDSKLRSQRRDAFEKETKCVKKYASEILSMLALYRLVADDILGCVAPACSPIAFML